MSNDCKRKYVIKFPALVTKGEKGDKGDKGNPGDPTLILPVSTDDVDYRGEVLTDVLDALFYQALTLSLSASPNTYEKGVVLTSQAVSWSYNKSVQAQSITGVGVVSPTLLLSDRAKVLTLSNVSTNTVITLTADDVLGDDYPQKSTSVTLRFLNRLYYGKALVGTINSAFVLALSTQPLSSTRQVNFNITTGENEFIWFCCPVAYGTPSFKTNGFNGGLTLEATITLVNASGYSESYNVYKSDNHNLGLTSVEVL